MARPQVFVEEVLGALTLNQGVKITKLLADYPLEDLRVDTFRRLLMVFLDKTFELRQDKVVGPLLAGFARCKDKLDGLHILTYLASKNTVDFDLFQWLAQVGPAVPLKTHLRKLAKHGESHTSAFAASRILSVAPEITLEDLCQADKEAEEFGNNRLKAFIRAAIKEISPDMQKPNYLRSAPTSFVMPEGLEYPSNEVLIDQAMRLIQENFILKSHTNSEVEEKLRVHLNSLSDAERLSFFQQLPGPLRQVDIIFQMLGPLNVSERREEDPDHPCQKFGGCRMFTCHCTPLFNEYDEAAEDWFTGHCEECAIRIVNRRWAVRTPLLTGGWSGCFCSWDCVRHQINPTLYEEETEDNPFDPDMNPDYKSAAYTDEDQARIDQHIVKVDALEESVNFIGLFE